jgi:2-hydroxy-3-keto-5-methylthiopentenyl-1-phosphate phosphatase
VRALLIDFDETACLQDASEMLLDAFGEPDWKRFDDAVDRGEMSFRERTSTKPRCSAPAWDGSR